MNFHYKILAYSLNNSLELSYKNVELYTLEDLYWVLNLLRSEYGIEKFDGYFHPKYHHFCYSLNLPGLELNPVSKDPEVDTFISSDALISMCAQGVTVYLFGYLRNYLFCSSQENTLFSTTQFIKKQKESFEHLIDRCLAAALRRKDENGVSDRPQVKRGLFIQTTTPGKKGGFPHSPFDAPLSPIPRNSLDGHGSDIFEHDMGDGPVFTTDVDRRHRIVSGSGSEHGTSVSECEEAGYGGGTFNTPSTNRTAFMDHSSVSYMSPNRLSEDFELDDQCATVRRKLDPFEVNIQYEDNLDNMSWDGVYEYSIQVLNIEMNLKYTAEVILQRYIELGGMIDRDTFSTESSRFVLELCDYANAYKRVNELLTILYENEQPIKKDRLSDYSVLGQMVLKLSSHISLFVNPELIEQIKLYIVTGVVDTEIPFSQAFSFFYSEYLRTRLFNPDSVEDPLCGILTELSLGHAVTYRDVLPILQSDTSKFFFLDYFKLTLLKRFVDIGSFKNRLDGITVTIKQSENRGIFRLEGFESTVKALRENVDEVDVSVLQLLEQRLYWLNGPGPNIPQSPVGYQSVSEYLRRYGVSEEAIEFVVNGCRSLFHYFEYTDVCETDDVVATRLILSRFGQVSFLKGVAKLLLAL